MKQSLLFANKANRDARYAEMKAQGIVAKRGSIRNQQIHPMYVEDEKQGLTAQDCGFGNTIYKTLYGTLYTLDVAGFDTQCYSGQPLHQTFNS